MHTLSASSELHLAPPVESCKATLFKIADHWFALPATAILRVISFAALEQTEKGNRLTLWENRPLIRLDLYPLLKRTSIDRPSNREESQSYLPKFFMIVGLQTGDQCAIAVDELPGLCQISLSKVQVLPTHYRQAISHIAKYMIVYPYHGRSLSVLLLDLQQAITRSVH